MPRILGGYGGGSCVVVAAGDDETVLLPLARASGRQVLPQWTRSAPRSPRCRRCGPRPSSAPASVHHIHPYIISAPVGGGSERCTLRQRMLSIINKMLMHSMTTRWAEMPRACFMMCGTVGGGGALTLLSLEHADGLDCDAGLADVCLIHVSNSGRPMVGGYMPCCLCVLHM